MPVTIGQGNPPPDITPQFILYVHLRYGQSWESNSFDSFELFGINQNGVIAAVYKNQIGGLATLPNAAGVAYAVWGEPNTIVGDTLYQPDDQVSIGRCAIIAQQLLQARDGVEVLDHIMEMCFAFPGATWYSGTGGGLAPGATFTASITNDVMTATGTPDGVLVVGQLISGTGIPPGGSGHGYIITSFGTGMGGAGTYNTAQAQFWIGPLNPITGHFDEVTIVTAHATFLADMARGAIPGNIMNAAAVISGTITIGDALPTPPALAGSIIAQQLSGPTGGAGLYRVLAGTAVTVGSEQMTAQSASWKSQLLATSQLVDAIPIDKAMGVRFLSVGYTQGSSFPLNTEAAKIADLVSMLTVYDALNLPGAGTTGMIYYLGLPAAISHTTVFEVSSWGTYTFCRTNAPGQGGTWSGRCFATSPSYAWQFIGTDDIHTGAYGTCRWGEQGGYVEDLVRRLGILWTPLWRPLTGGAILISGQIITVPMARPTSPDYADVPMVWQSDPDDGIKVWPNFGWNVKRGSTLLTLLDVAIDGMNVVLTVSETLNSGDTLEVSYAWYGPGGPNPGPSSGVGGNLVMNGPDSVLFPGKTIDAWAWPFFENVTI